MPTYVYACKNCSHRFEQYQSFSEDSLSTCPECTQDALRKVFDSVGIVFKGPGFYSTDSSSAGASTASSSSSSSESSSSGTGSSESSSTSASPSSDSTASSSQPAAAAS
ncbi:FmdB family zinc ribbon protein [Brachybacterium saurashtrense]|uniref:FmdB family transcriptional regulator n=1 Tax=Brachybacterium saurashtrense TaxID=556288 RepID=A0A345YLN4_9MICO|nr:FmdB family zinc ribbon protein [Brachybacterium saurashtrense]AXK44836.1 FmdB family transcriptional regulator [Brachybacterium saurashtrense]RRR20812.1 FmdB family transcriptional regulator [Brachybacterium saurashtrense]